MPSPTPRHSQAGGPDLDQYLRAPRPASWLILGVVLALLAMVLTWSLVGTMKTTVTVTGVKDGAHFTGYLKPADALSLATGMPVEYEGDEVGMLTNRDTTTLTAAEVASAVDNLYYTSQLALAEHNVTVAADVNPNACPDGVVTLEIVVAETTPFNFFMG